MRAIEELAEHPNVAAKISPVVHSDQDPPLTLDSVAPFVTHLAERFGPTRIFYGSNWPVAAAVTSYRAWVELLDRLLGQDARFWTHNASRLYRLQQPGPVSNA